MINSKQVIRAVIVFSLLALSACATTTIPPEKCPPNRQALENCPPLGAVDDTDINQWYRIRGELSDEELGDDPIQIGIDAEILVKNAYARLLGSSETDAIRSLTAKIHMIENAQLSVDAVYYIFQHDLAGKALLGAMCEAVQRGVDVRLMVDSVGSVGLDKTWLRALHSCEINAGFIQSDRTH